MNPSPTTLPRARAFTLVEVMLAITILVGITLLAEQVVSQVSQAWLQGRGRAETFNVSRALFNRVALDLHNAVLPEDLPAFPNNDLAFYTRRPAIGGERALSFIRYTLENVGGEPGVIMRSDIAYAWSGGESIPPWGETAMPSGNIEKRRLASHVLGFTHRFAQRDGTLSEEYQGPDADNPTTGVILTLAVADDRAMQILTTSGRATALIGDLEGRVGTSDKATADLWEEIVESPSLPAPVRSGVRIFERTIALPRPISRPAGAEKSS